MIITYLRSSSYGAWDFCPHKYFLDYTLGYHSPANIKADKGTITHKGLELLAQLKLARQNGKKTFYDTELKTEYKTNSFNIEEALASAFQHYKAFTPQYAWSDNDLIDCRNWLYKALAFNDGMFSPLKRTVIKPEQYFDFEIVKPWSAYSYTLPNGKKVEGYLSLKGTVDLIVEVPNYPKAIELIDWKTGQYRKDINTGKVKDYYDLMEDPQLRIYHYALKHLYPNVEEIIITIFFINAGGPYTLHFTDKDLKQTEKMIQKRFEVIRKTTRPKLIYPHPFKCKKLCWFYKHDPDGSPVDDYSKSACKIIKNELIQLGMDKVLAKRAKASFDSYGSGGGRYNV